MAAFWQSLLVVFLLELGDKTQLVALCLSCRYNARVVLAGIFAATLAVHVISVLLGGIIERFVGNPGWISLVAGLAFLGFGAWTLRGDSLDDDNCGATRMQSAFWLVATTFFLAELGDKTMLGTVALATDAKNLPMLIAVWLGSSIGMVLSDGLAIFVGQILGKRLPERLIKFGAAVIFVGYGIYKTILGARILPTYAWTIAAVVTVALAVWLVIELRKPRPEQPDGFTCVEDEPVCVEEPAAKDKVGV